MTTQTYACHSHTVPVAFDKKSDKQEAEECGQPQDNAHPPTDRIKKDINQHRAEPETEMRKDMHHHIQDDRRCGTLHSDIGSKLHNPVRLPSHQSYGSDIIQRKTGNREFIEPGERQ